MADLSPSDLAILQQTGVPVPSGPSDSGALSDSDKAILQQTGVPLPASSATPASAAPSDNSTGFKKGSAGDYLFHGDTDNSGRGFWSRFMNPPASKPDSTPIEHGIGEALGYPSGLTSTAILEGLNRIKSGGENGVGSEDWHQALAGQSPGLPAGLQKMGMGKVASYAVGLPVQAMTDPLASIFAGATDAAPAATLGSTLKQQAKVAVPFGEAISDTVQGAGKKVFQNAFRKTDSALSTKTSLPKNAYSNMAWNDGNPLISGSNEDMQVGATQLRKDIGSKIGKAIQDAGGDSTFDLAPDLVKNAKSDMVEKGLDVAGESSDALDADPHEYIKGLIANRATRQQGLDLLAKSAPDLADAIQAGAKHLKNDATNPGMLDMYNSLINDLAEGPRSLEELQSLKTSIAAKAAAKGAYEKGKQLDPSAGVAADFASAIGDKIDSIVDGKVEAASPAVEAAAQTSPEALTIWQKLKQQYSIARKGEGPTNRALGVAMNRQNSLIPSFTDMATGGAAAHFGGPLPLAGAVGAKVAKELTYNPAFATRVAKGLHTVGNTNLWDNMLRQQIINSSKSKPVNGDQQ